MKYNQIVKRLGELEYGLTDGVSEYIEMLEEYIELYNQINEFNIRRIKKKRRINENRKTRENAKI